MIDSLRLHVLTRGPLSGHDWRELIRLQCAWSELLPTHYGLYEPIRQEFRVDSLDAASQEVWASDLSIRAFLWKNQRIEGDIGIKFSPMPQYADVAAWNRKRPYSPAHEADCKAMTAYLMKVANQFDPLFGFVHLLAEPEIGRLGAAGVLTLQSSPKAEHRVIALGTTPMLLRKWVPDLFWATVFGRPYVKLFGKDRLLSAPAALTVELAPDIVYLQLTDSMTDMRGNFEAVDSARAAVKHHLALDTFYRPDADKTHQYVVPEILLE